MSDEAKIICKFFGSVVILENGEPVKYLWNPVINQPEPINEMIVKGKLKN